MSTAPPRRPRRGPRRGSLERPVSGRTYRGTWLLVALPVLLAAFSVTRPAPLPAPDLPPAFDAASAHELTRQLATRFPDRAPGTPGQRGALRWLVAQLRPYGFVPRIDRFTAHVPGRGTLPFANVVAVAPGLSSSAIVVLAHRDNRGASPGANDNASGTAALVELARSYANPRGTSGTPAATQRVLPRHTLVFLSSDGGALGGIGAARFAADPHLAGTIAAVVGLDAIAGRGRPRLVFAGNRARFADVALVATAAARVLERTGVDTARPSGFGQLLDLAFPFSFYEQAPFVGRGVSALTLTSGGERPPPDIGDFPGDVRIARLAQLGSSAQQLLASLDSGLELAQGTGTYLYLDTRVVRGWAVEAVLIAALLPFLAVAVDVFALCRRRRIRLTPAVRSLRSRLGFWAWVLLVFLVFRLVGLWPTGAALPPPPAASAGTEWPVGALVALAVLGAAAWLVARDRLLPRRRIADEEQLAGYAVALVALALVSLVVAAAAPFSLVFLLPALHAWLWLPQLRRTSLLPRLATMLAGFLGPVLLVGSFAVRFGLGVDALWYVTSLAAVGYVPLFALVVAAVFAATAAQFSALAAGRYAPYPTVRERPPLGPVRRVLRRAVLASRRRRGHRRAAVPHEAPDALEGG